jgi:hypothetical protein
MSFQRVFQVQKALTKHSLGWHRVLASNCDPWVLGMYFLEKNSDYFRRGYSIVCY